jgi:hypothetical protein
VSSIVANSALEKLVGYAPATPLVLLGLPALAGLVGVALVGGVAHAWRATGAAPKRTARAAEMAAAVVVAWAVFCLVLAKAGVLAHFESRPPPLFGVMIVALLGTALIGRSAIGERLVRGLPLWLLVGSQSFRLPLELVMHRAATTGTMPVEMSFSGYNFDILTGVFAVVVAIGLKRGSFGRRVTSVWNNVGLVLLLGINVIALLATPVFHAFGPGHLNLWIADPPFVLLPTFLVPSALLGHILVFRALRRTRESAANPLSLGVST